MQEESAERTVVAKLIRCTFDPRTLGIEVVMDIGPESVEVYLLAQIAEVAIHLGVVRHQMPIPLTTDGKRKSTPVLLSGEIFFHQLTFVITDKPGIAAQALVGGSRDCGWLKVRDGASACIAMHSILPNPRRPQYPLPISAR